MKLLDWTVEQSRLLLGSMARVATQGGATSLGKLDRSMLESVQDHLLHTDLPLDGLPSPLPDELAAGVSDPEHRLRAVTLLTLVVYSATELHPTRADLVDAYARALDVKSDALRYLREMRRGQMWLLKLDYLRGAIAAGGLPGDRVIDKLAAAVQVLREPRGDAEVAIRFQALEKLPAGSLGRTFFDFYRSRGYPLPGEPGCIPEGIIVIHDLSHILTGFNTDRTDEIAVVACQAGYMKKHPYEMILDGLTSFHMGIMLDVQLDISPAKGHLDPHRMMQGLERGMKMKTDLMDHWDYSSVLSEPVGALRERYGIVGATDVWRTPPPADPEDLRAAKPK